MKETINKFLETVEENFEYLNGSLDEAEYEKITTDILSTFRADLKHKELTAFPHSVVFAHFKNNDQSREKNDLWSLFFERSEEILNFDILISTGSEAEDLLKMKVILHKIRENVELTNAQKVMVNENIGVMVLDFRKALIQMRKNQKNFEQSFEETVSNYNIAFDEVNDLRNRLNESIELQETIRTENQNAKKRGDELTQNYDELLKKQNVISDDQKKTQKEFVTILGIFTTIIFAAFGGIQLLSGILTNISNSKLVVSIISGSFVFISIIIILSLLFSGLSKMADLSVRSCGCTDKKTCECKLSDKHPTIFYSFLLVLIVLPFALLSRYISFETLITNTIGVEKGINWSGIPRMLEVTIFALVPAIVFYTLDSKKIGPLIKFWTWPWIVSVSRGVKNRVLSWKWIRNFFKLDKSEKKSMVEENKAHSE